MTHTVHLPLILNQEPRLRDLFGKHGIRFGFCVQRGNFMQNTIKRQLIIDHANIVSTESQMNMKFIQPEQGVYDFSVVDDIVGHCQELGIELHGIPASWGLDALNPDWLVKGSFSNEQLADILEDHVSKLAAHYKDKLISLDTCNEACITGFDPIYGGVWAPLGDDYVRISFESARGYGYPVLYNSFFPEPAEAEYDKALELVDSGLADAIGIQLHLWTGSWEPTLSRTEDFLKRIRAAGGWCRFSEISVLANTHQSQAANDWAQAVVYAAITRLAIKYEDMVRDVVVWGVTDEGAWRRKSTLFDREGKPKLAYDAVVKELKK